MNILFTCAGRRNYLLHYFRAALDGTGRVLAADASPASPALQEADGAFRLPPVDDPSYLSCLLELCQREQVAAVISLNDLELPLLADARQEFLEAGIRVVVSSPDVVEICFDKWKSMRFFSELGISCPRSWLTLESARGAIAAGELTFPVVVKPRWGSASIGIEYPRDIRELELVWELAHHKLKRTILAAVSDADARHSVMIQQYLPGVEYGLDVINDLQGSYRTTVVKQKLAMRAGETDRARVVEHPRLMAEGRRLAERLRHVANLDCDFFEHDGKLYGLEMNPRFGGGYPFSHIAGLDLPRAIVGWLRGDPVPDALFAVRYGVQGAKCDRLVTVEQKSAPGRRSRHEYRASG